MLGPHESRDCPPLPHGTTPYTPRHKLPARRPSPFPRTLSPSRTHTPPLLSSELSVLTTLMPSTRGGRRPPRQSRTWRSVEVGLRRTIRLLERRQRSCRPYNGIGGLSTRLPYRLRCRSPAGAFAILQTRPFPAASPSSAAVRRRGSRLARRTARALQVSQETALREDQTGVAR
ncbi:hypothetical protein BJY59DRAFT_601998 [Rhodotorula toruloides]